MQKPEKKNSIFLKKCKTTICRYSIRKNLEISETSGEGMDLTNKFISWSLVTLMNYVEF